MASRTWYSRKVGSTTPLITIDVYGWTDYEGGYEFHRVDDSNGDIGSGERDFTSYDADAWRLIFSDKLGGTEITGATCYGSLGEVAVNGTPTAGELRVTIPEAKTGALQTHLEAAGKSQFGILYANLVGTESGKVRPQFWARVHLQFRTKAAS